MTGKWLVELEHPQVRRAWALILGVAEDRLLAAARRSRTRHMKRIEAEDAQVLCADQHGRHPRH